MKHAIAIAKARLKKLGTSSKRPQEVEDVELEITRLGLGAIIIIGGLLGLGGLVTLVAGLLSKHGPISFLFKSLAAKLFGG